MTGPVRLDVRGRKINTTVATLTNDCGYFQTFFSGEWVIPKLPDGSVSVNEDPDLFEHLLKFLQYGAFPRAYDETRHRHDVELYDSLAWCSRYYKIPKLDAWLRGRLWEKLVIVKKDVVSYHHGWSTSFGWVVCCI